MVVRIIAMGNNVVGVLLDNSTITWKKVEDQFSSICHHFYHLIAFENRISDFNLKSYRMFATRWYQLHEHNHTIFIIILLQKMDSFLLYVIIYKQMFGTSIRM